MNYEQLMRRAYEVAQNSPDPSTQNSALLVNSDGDILMEDINRFPDGVQYKPERWERPLKYKIIEHAERNVIYSCAYLGVATKGLIMVSPWAACSDCARAIIQAKLTKLVTHKQACDRSPKFWRDEIDIAFTMLNEAGVEIQLLDCTFGDIEIRHSGEIWKP